jgi:hypothetical protein
LRTAARSLGVLTCTIFSDIFLSFFRWERVSLRIHKSTPKRFFCLLYYRRFFIYFFALICHIVKRT